MTAKKKTMYEILEVSPNASYADIKAAHKRLSVALMSGSMGLSRDDCKFELNLLDVALHALSAPSLRDNHDEQVASATAPCNITPPIKSNIVPFGDEEKALKKVAAIKDSYKIASVSMDSNQFPLKEITSTVSTSVSSLKKILRLIIGLAVLGFVLKAGQAALSSRQTKHTPIEVVKAEEKLIIQEYYKKHGVRPASRAEAEFLETENRRKENELREAAFAEKRKEEEYRNFVEESRQEGAQIHTDIARAEQRERSEEMQKQRYLAEQKRQQEEMAKEQEDMRIAEERRKLGLN